MMRVLLTIVSLLALLRAGPGNAEPFKVAAIFAKTGQAATQNADNLRGVRLAAAEINARGGILGEPLEILELDNRSTPIGAKVAAEEAARIGVRAIVGCSWSSHSLAAAQVAQRHGIPMISDISTSPALTQVGDYIFRVCYTDAFQGKVMARLARDDLRAGTAVVLVDINDDYSLDLANEFSREFTLMGGIMVPDIHYKHGQASYREVVQAAKAAKTQVCFIPGHDESGIIAAQIVREGATCILLGGDGWDSSAFYAKGGSELDDGYYCTHWHPRSATPASRDLMARQGEAELVAPVVLAYDALMLLADAAARAGTPDRASIRDALANTRNYPGVTGAISFLADGDPAKSAVIMRIRKGKQAYYRNEDPN